MNKPETGDFLEIDLITLHHRDLTKNLEKTSGVHLNFEINYRKQY